MYTLVKQHKIRKKIKQLLFNPKNIFRLFLLGKPASLVNVVISAYKSSKSQSFNETLKELNSKI